MKMLILVLPLILSGCVYMFEGDPTASCNDVKAKIVGADSEGMKEQGSAMACTFSHAPSTSQA
ncbi:MAG: hypothetical protein NPIRA02_07010 [Nitrospirales bacterium]|nr:MAG: hypothetical protein NPIRA02_07010 [Nitrospirales bacterium]